MIVQVEPRIALPHNPKIVKDFKIMRKVSEKFMEKKENKQGGEGIQAQIGNRHTQEKGDKNSTQKMSINELFIDYLNKI